MRIDDWPDFPNRGVMLDISRDKVPKMETLFSLVDLLSGLKVNQLQLYTEHTFAYREHEDVWKDASPMTGEQVLELDAYCRGRFVELVPNQNSFGHMEKWLMQPGYADLAEDPERKWPQALNPLDPDSISLIKGLYDELLPHFSSRRLNIGCDEVSLGTGHTREAVNEHGAGRVYLDFLLKVNALAQRHGRTAQFWGDIVVRHPELIPELPRDMIALEWGYSPDHPFAENGAKFAGAGLPIYVCPGTSTWNSISGRTDDATANIRSAAENGLAVGAIGLLNTDWGDSGHWQHLPVSYLGYAYGAAVGWATKANADIDLPSALDAHVFRDRAGVMGQLAYDLGNAYQQAGPRGQRSALHALLLRAPRFEDVVFALTAEELHEAEEYVDAVAGSLSKARMDRLDAQLVSDEFRNAAALLRYACHAGTARAGTAAPNAGQIPREGLGTRQNRIPLQEHLIDEIAAMAPTTRRNLAEEFEPVLEEFKRLWTVRNRPGGLMDSTERWESFLREYQR